MSNVVDAGNYEVGFMDVDGRPKRVKLFISEDQMRAASGDGFRYIVGYEKKGADNFLKVIRFGDNQTFTLDQIR